MLRVGQPQAEAPEAPMPEQMQAASQPDLSQAEDQPSSGDHKQDLIEALTYMQMAMELIMNCLQKYQEEAPDAGSPEPDEETLEGGGAGAPPLPGQ